jgi:hypothetical protein
MENNLQDDLIARIINFKDFRDRETAVWRQRLGRHVATEKTMPGFDDKHYQEFVRIETNPESLDTDANIEELVVGGSYEKGHVLRTIVFKEHMKYKLLTPTEKTSAGLELMMDLPIEIWKQWDLYYMENNRRFSYNYLPDSEYGILPDRRDLEVVLVKDLSLDKDRHEWLVMFVKFNSEGDFTLHAFSAKHCYISHPFKTLKGACNSWGLFDKGIQIHQANELADSLSEFIEF